MLLFIICKNISSTLLHSVDASESSLCSEGAGGEHQCVLVGGEWAHSALKSPTQCEQLGLTAKCHQGESQSEGHAGSVSWC